MTRLKGFTTAFGETELTDTIEASLVEFFNWGFVNIGAYVNINQASGVFGGSFSRLRPINQPGYTNGRVWEAIRGNWVWESGLSIGSPINISGVYINNILQTSGYTLDYINGRVIFTNAVPASSGVTLNYSYKEVQFTTSNNPLLAQFRSRRVDDSDFLVNSGLYTSFSNAKINLPCVAFEVVRRENEPFQLGGGQWSKHTIKAYVFGEDPSSRKIADIISNQDRLSFYALDLDKMGASGVFPLKHDGSINSRLTYPNLVPNYVSTDVYNGLIHIKDCSMQHQQIQSDLYLSTVTLTTEAVVPKI